METPEKLYKYWEFALEYCIEKYKLDGGTQKSLAIEANISKQYLSDIISKTNPKKASLEVQKKLSSKLGYSYENFLELGKALLKASHMMGGHQEMFRQGYKTYLDLMPDNHRANFYSDLPIDRQRFEAFLAGQCDLLTDDEQHKILNCYIKGTYEYFIIYAMKNLHIGVRDEEQERVNQLLAEKQRHRLTLIPNNKIGGFDPKTATHDEIISRFKNKDWARTINALLLEIESDPVLRDTVLRVIKAIAQQTTSHDRAEND